MSTHPIVDVRKLQVNVRWALANGLGRRDLIPMLERLREHADHGSEASVFARLELAELIMEHNPFRAARLAREVLGIESSHRAWGLLGLAHTLLGNYRSARRAYGKALALSPESIAYTHNLGHLLDLAFDAPRAALPLLQAAHRAEPDEPEIAGSYAHALLRAGQPDRARRVLERALGCPGEVDTLLARWSASRQG